MNNCEYVAANLSAEEILCQTAEEAAELAQAALKLRRVGVGTTPVDRDTALANLEEEVADVLACLDVLDETNLIHYEKVWQIQAQKMKRWRERVENGQKLGSP